MNDSTLIFVDRKGNWSWYNPVLPPGMTALGTIRRGLGDTGALFRVDATGIYVQANAGSMRSLDQRAVQLALDALDAAPPPPAGPGEGVEP